MQMHALFIAYITTISYIRIRMYLPLYIAICFTLAAFAFLLA